MEPGIGGCVVKNEKPDLWADARRKASASVMSNAFLLVAVEVFREIRAPMGLLANSGVWAHLVTLSPEGDLQLFEDTAEERNGR